MMQATKMIIALSLASAVHAEDMAESCLQHLSGGAADVQCYSILKKNQEGEIKKLYAEIKIATSKNLEAYSEVRKYMDSVNSQMRACELKKIASNQWKRVRDDTPNMTEHHYYDVVYRECQYSIRRQQKLFLKDLIDLSQDN